MPTPQLKPSPQASVDPRGHALSVGDALKPSLSSACWAGSTRGFPRKGNFTVLE